MPPAVGLVRLMAGAALVAVSGCGASPDSAGFSSAESTGLEVPYSAVTDRFVRCMRDAGWEAEPDWGGGVGVPGVPFSQQTQVDDAMDGCAESSGWNAAYHWEVWSSEQVRQLYEQEVAEHECLVALGVASHEPPTEHTYFDTFATGDQYYGMMPGILHPEVYGFSLQSLVSMCPPPTWFPNMDGF